MEQINDIVGWLKEHATEMGLSAVIYPDGARTDNSWLHLPVRIEGEMGAYERAEHLQDLEDAWDEQHPGDSVKLLLIPAAP